MWEFEMCVGAPFIKCHTETHSDRLFKLLSSSVFFI